MSSQVTLTFSTTVSRRWVRVTQGKSEVLHGNSQRIQDFGVYSLFFQVDQVHLLTDSLHSSFRTQGSDIGTDETVGLGGNGFQVNIINQLHVLGVNLEDFQSTGKVWNTNVDFSVESTESSQGGVDRVGSVGGGNDDDIGSGLHTIHQRQQSGNHSSFDFTVGLVSLWSNGVDFIDEDNGRRVLFGFFKGLSQVRLGFTGHLRHDFGTVDQEEEGTGLVGDGTGHDGLTGTGRTVHQNTLWRLDTNGLEQLRVAQGQLDQLSNSGHLLFASTNVVVAHFVDVVLFVFSVDWLTLAVDDGVSGDDGGLLRVDLDDLELDSSHTTPDGEQVPFTHGSVGLDKVRLQVHVEQRAGDTVDGVGDGQDRDPVGVLDVGTRVNGDDVAQSDSQVVTNTSVNTSHAGRHLVVRQHNQHGVLSLLALDQDGVAPEQLQQLHGLGGHGDNGIVVIDSIIDN